MLRESFGMHAEEFFFHLIAVTDNAPGENRRRARHICQQVCDGYSPITQDSAVASVSPRSLNARTISASSSLQALFRNPSVTTEVASSESQTRWQPQITAEAVVRNLSALAFLISALKVPATQLLESSGRQMNSFPGIVLLSTVPNSTFMA